MAVERLATAANLRVWLDLAEDDVDELPDARAELLLDGVSGQVLRYCRRPTFAVVDAVGVILDGNGARELVLPGAPVVALSTVIEDPEGDATEISDSVEWSATGVLRHLAGTFAARLRWYEVDYSHGYDDVPEDVRNLVCRVAARAVSNPEGLGTEAVGSYSAGFAFDETRLATLSAPDRRELDPFRL